MMRYCMFKSSGLGTLMGASVLALGTTAAAGTVRGYGTVRYFENGANGGSTQPLVAARVTLKDDDGWLGSSTLRTGYLGADGGFDLSATADDGLWQGKLDPFIEIELETSGGRLVVESEILKINVKCSTSSRSETEGTINFGTLACGGSEGKDASALFAHMKKAYDRFTATTGISSIPRHDGKAAVLFPVLFAAGVPWTTEESVHWPGGYRDFKAVFHEFGHRTRHAQDGDFGHFLGDVASYTYTQQHWLNKETNEGFAFNEGWAEFNAAQSDTSAASTLAGWTMVKSGADNIEGNVAAKLHRVSAACGGFGRMWSTLASGSFHRYTDFANKLKADFNASATLRSTHPTCVSAILASQGQTVIAPKVKLLPIPILGGARAPTEKDAEALKAAVADQSALLNAMADGAKARAAKLKSRNRMALKPKFKAFGDALSKERDDFEARAAAKLETHVKRLKPHDGSKAAVEARRAEHQAFLKDVFADRVATVERQLKALGAERAKLQAGPEADVLDKQKARADALLAELRKAAQTGEAKSELLPRCFDFSADSMP